MQHGQNIAQPIAPKGRTRGEPGTWAEPSAETAKPVPYSKT